MAHHKSAIKRIKTNEKSRSYNKHFKVEASLVIKSVLETKSQKDGTEKINGAFKLLDQLVRKNIIPKNKAANKKSQLSKHINSLKK